MDAGRAAAGGTALGIGTVLAPIGAAVYAALAMVAVWAAGVCVDASNWICAAGPLVLAPIAVVACAAALVATSIGAASMLAGFAALQSPRPWLLAAFSVAASAILALGIASAIWAVLVWTSISEHDLAIAEHPSFAQGLGLALLAAPLIVHGGLGVLYTLPRWWLLARPARA